MRHRRAQAVEVVDACTLHEDGLELLLQGWCHVLCIEG